MANLDDVPIFDHVITAIPIESKQQAFIKTLMAHKQWKSVSGIPVLSEEFLWVYQNYLDWDQLKPSLLMRLSPHFIEAILAKNVVIKELFKYNPNIKDEYVGVYPIDWVTLLQLWQDKNPALNALSFRHSDQIDWVQVSMYPDLQPSFINLHKLQVEHTLILQHCKNFYIESDSKYAILKLDLMQNATVNKFLCPIFTQHEVSRSNKSYSIDANERLKKASLEQLEKLSQTFLKTPTTKETIIGISKKVINENTISTEQQNDTNTLLACYLNELEKDVKTIKDQEINQAIKPFIESTTKILTLSHSETIDFDKTQTFVSKVLPVIINSIKHIKNLELCNPTETKTNVAHNELRKQVIDTIEATQSEIESLFDSSFDSLATAVSADIEVLKTIMAQDGLGTSPFRQSN